MTISPTHEDLGNREPPVFQPAVPSLTWTQATVSLRARPESFLFVSLVEWLTVLSVGCMVGCGDRVALALSRRFQGQSNSLSKENLNKYTWQGMKLWVMCKYKACEQVCLFFVGSRSREGGRADILWFFLSASAIESSYPRPRAGSARSWQPRSGGWARWPLQSI